MTETHALVVDDDPDIRTLVVMALELRPGITVHQANGGAAAIRALETLTPTFAVLDVMMPDVDGPAVFRHMQSIDRLRGVPVVFLTAKVQRHEVDELTALGAAGVLAKPFDPFTLSEALEKLLLARCP